MIFSRAADPGAKRKGGIRAFKALLAGLLQRVRETPPLFTSELTVATTDLEPLKVEHWPGLLQYQILSGESESRRLVLYWNSYDAYLAHGAEIGHILGAAMERQGFALRAVGKKRSHLKEPSFWYNLFLYVAAAYGAFQAVSGISETLLASPRVEFALSNPGTIPLLENAAFALNLQLINTSTNTDATVSLEWARLESVDGHSIALTFPQSPLRIDRGGKARELVVSGTAPAQGEYRLVANGIAKAGKLRGERWVILEREVKVWPPLSWSALQVVNSGGKRCRLRGELTIGNPLPENRFAEALLEGHPGVQLFAVVFPEVKVWPDPQHDATPGAEVTYLSWPVRGLEPFKTYAFDLLLTGERATDWQTVAADLQLRCCAEVAP